MNRLNNLKLDINQSQLLEDVLHDVLTDYHKIFPYSQESYNGLKTIYEDLRKRPYK